MSVPGPYAAQLMFPGRLHIIRWRPLVCKTTPRGAPKNPLQLGATFWHFRHESRVTSPPIWAQNLMLPPLWALAKAFGIRPYYDHWDSRTRPAGPHTRGTLR